MVEQTVETMINQIKSRQATIDDLLNKGAIIPKNNTSLDSGEMWILDTIYQEHHCTIGFASCKDINGVFPEHIHLDVVEYLICLEGKFAERFGKEGEYGVQILNVGDIVTIPADTVHSSKALVENTKLAFICVPADLAFGPIEKRKT